MSIDGNNTENKELYTLFCKMEGAPVTKSYQTLRT